MRLALVIKTLQSAIAHNCSKWPLLLIALISVASIALNLNQPVDFDLDEPSHMLASLNYSHYLRNTDIGKEMHFWSVSYNYPPLVSFMTGCGFALTGFSESIATLCTSLFIPILLFSVYGIARRLRFQTLQALAASLSLLLCYPLFRMSRQHMLDFPLTAMIVLTVWAAMATKGFRTRLPSLRFGAIIGLAMLTKWTAPLYLCAPCLFLIYHSWSNPKSRRHIIEAFALATAIASIWYIPNIGSVLNTAFSVGFYRTGPAQIGAPIAHSIFSVKRWTSFGQMLPLLWPWPLLLLAVLGAIGSVWRRDKYKGFLAIWLISTYLLTSTLSGREDRFIIPLIPVCALATMEVYRLKIIQKTAWINITFTAAFALALLSIHPLVMPDSFLYRQLHIILPMTFPHDASSEMYRSKEFMNRTSEVVRECSSLCNTEPQTNNTIAVLVKNSSLFILIQDEFHKSLPSANVIQISSPAQYEADAIDRQLDYMLLIAPATQQSSKAWPTKEMLDSDWQKKGSWPLLDTLHLHLYAEKLRIIESEIQRQQEPDHLR